MVARAAASSSLAGGGGDLIRPRPRAGLVACVAVAALFAAAAAALAAVDGWIPPTSAGQPAVVTARAPLFSGEAIGDRSISGGLIVARGEIAGPAVAAVAAEIGARRAARLPLLAGLLGGLGLLLAVSLRVERNGRLLRFQLVTAGLLVAWLALAKAVLLLTPISVLALPAAAVAVLAAVTVGPRAGPIAGLVAGVALALLSPLDGGVVAVLAAQGAAAGLVAWRWRSPLGAVVAGIAAAVAAVGATAVAIYATGGGVSLGAGEPFAAMAIAAAAGGLISGPAALVLAPIAARLAGEPSRRRLIALHDFSNALLQDIAGRSPGTWQHSLAMATMAEAAVEAIGGNGPLVRAGAYYHDLGKSLQPKYFAENLPPGEPSPHDALEPELSARIIAAHVTEGVRIGRQAGLPERVIDFMHMHHGGEVVTSAWARYQAAGGGALSIDDFRYPGDVPRTPETGVLAICDAVERAAREVEGVDTTAARQLVQHVIGDQIERGRLARCGLDGPALEAVGKVLGDVIAQGTGNRPESSRRDLATVAIRKAAPTPTPTPADDVGPTAPAPAPRPSPEPAPGASHPTRSLRPTQLGVEAPPHAPESSVKLEAASPASSPSIPSGPSASQPFPPASDEPQHPIDVEATNPLAPKIPATDATPRRPSPRTEQLSEWQEALELVTDDPPPAGSRVKQQTVERVKAPGDEPPLEATSLSPGTLVIGPPPETHPENAFGDHTVERRLPIPRESIRPSKRRTAERDVVVPPEAFPDDTEPSAIIIRPRRRDDDST